MTDQLQNFVVDCVNHYATYRSTDEFYSLQVSALPDFVQHEFSALIMGGDEAYASEATGPDNALWDNKMLPALTKYLANSTDKDAQIEFNKTWLECITAYLTNHMQSLIDDALYEFNDDHGYIRPASYYYGVPAYGPI